MTTINYINGNYNVSILQDGTKIREYEATPLPTFPESIDIKITNYCDMGCSYCHESSTKQGVHGDLLELSKVLSQLPTGIEVAIGGGNPLSHPDLIDFLYRNKKQGLISNITINQGHLKTFKNLLTFLIKEELVQGIGISITSNNLALIKPYIDISNNIVYHVIAGVTPIETLNKLKELGSYCKVLILGYKQFGFGIEYYSKEVQEGITSWYRNLGKYIGKIHLSFDNLAIEQLKVKRFFTQEGWNKFYMGDDFVFTMYIDAVKQEFSPTSRSNDRESFNNYSLIQYFQKFKN